MPDLVACVSSWSALGSLLGGRRGLLVRHWVFLWSLLGGPWASLISLRPLLGDSWVSVGYSLGILESLWKVLEAVHTLLHGFLGSRAWARAGTSGRSGWFKGRPEGEHVGNRWHFPVQGKLTSVVQLTQLEPEGQEIPSNKLLRSNSFQISKFKGPKEAQERREGRIGGLIFNSWSLFAPGGPLDKHTYICINMYLYESLDCWTQTVESGVVRV